MLELVSTELELSTIGSQVYALFGFSLSDEMLEHVSGKYNVKIELKIIYNISFTVKIYSKDLERDLRSSL